MEINVLHIALSQEGVVNLHNRRLRIKNDGVSG